MIKIKKMQSNGYYVIQGRCTANSNFIETIDDAKVFLYYANQYLVNYLTIHEFIITKDGWLLQVKIKCRKTILKYYHQYINTDKEGRNRIVLKEVWLILSEQIRKFLSIFVKETNKLKGRTGAKVHSTYERYYFESNEEAVSYVEKIRSQLVSFAQKHKKYQGKKKHFKISKKKLKGCIFLVSKHFEKKKNRKKIGLRCFEYIGVKVLMASDLISKTIKVHKSP